MTRRELMLGGVLALIAGGGWWLSETVNAPEYGADDGSRRPDYFLRMFSNTVYDEEGLPSRELAATQMRHYPKDDSTEVDEPRLTLYREGGVRWTVVAEGGKLSGDGGVLLLEGNVTIERESAEQALPIRIETADMLVYPERNLAETGEEVRIASGKSWIHAKGMRAWFDESARIKLLSNVRGRYEIR